MNLRPLWLALLLAISTTPALAQDDAPKMMSDTMVDTLRVVQYGKSGSPIIFIPGLASGGWAFSSSVKRFAPNHVVYVVTLAGFDGMAPPAQKDGYIDLADAELEKLIQTRHLDHPILIGHSLGGTLALLFATTHSDLIGGIVTVDGLPVFPGTENMPSEHRGDMGVQARARVDTSSPGAFAKQQMDYAKSSAVMHEDMADQLAPMLARSDPEAVAQYLGEDLTLDFRAALPQVKVPVLLITPYNPADGQRMNPPHTQADKVAYYRTLMQGTPQLEVIAITPARHFVMFDQPEAFLNVLSAYVDHEAPH
jgi:pimeloyl-ACP methyl ester carboxylesterase